MLCNLYISGIIFERQRNSKLLWRTSTSLDIILKGSSKIWLVFKENYLVF